MKFHELLKPFKYAVTFNDATWDLGGYDDGGDTIDYVGTDINELALEVIANDPNFPMVFEVATEDDEWNVSGYFYEKAETAEDRAPVAIMYELFGNMG